MQIGISNLLAAILFLSACTPMKENSKYLFSEGVYKVYSDSFSSRKMYVEPFDSITKLYEYQNGSVNESKVHIVNLYSPQQLKPAKIVFAKQSFDIDFISIPFKIRASIKAVPAQFNTSINGGLFFGRRVDIYRLNRKKNLLGKPKTTIDHYGVSIGGFFGLGSTFINPTTTNNRIDIEYDGLIIPSGISLFFGYNNINFGLAVGIDYLNGRDRSFWIYRNKPWVGLGLGLNLN